MNFKILSACKKFYKLCLAKQEPLLLYHGTAGRHLSSILSQGLIVDPKEKVWKEDPNASFYNVSRVSIGGIYLTKNLMTAISSANNAVSDKENEKRLIVIVQVMPGSIAADEDLLPSSVQVTSYNGSYSESISCYLWSDLNNNSDVSEARQKYIDLNLTRISYDIPNINKNLIQRLYELLYDGFEIALARNVSHINADDYKMYCLRNGKDIPPQPEKQIAEQNYSKYLDKLTRVLKQLSINEINREEFGIRTARIDSNIRFSGSNKILAILELSPVRNFDYNVKIIYTSNDNNTSKALEDFKLQYSSNMTKDFKIY
jgi:hypothetical protein